MTNSDIAAKLQSNISQTKKTVAMGGIYLQYQKAVDEVSALKARLEAGEVDVAGILAMDKVAIRAVSDADFAFVMQVRFHAGLWHSEAAVACKEDTRRRGAATRAAHAAEAASREEKRQDFLPGQACGVHAFGTWYTGKVIRVTRTGSVVVEYTSGTGTTRQKTVGQDKIRA